jgi:hypothetical protein
MMLFTALIATVIIAMILTLIGLGRRAAFYGAVFAFGFYGILTLPPEWGSAAIVFVTAVTLAGYLWLWFRSTRGGKKFVWNPDIVRSVVAVPFAVSVNLIAAPEGVVAGMGVPAIEEAFDKAFPEYLTAVVAILVIYLAPRVVGLVTNLVRPKVDAE